MFAFSINTQYPTEFDRRKRLKWNLPQIWSVDPQKCVEMKFDYTLLSLYRNAYLTAIRLANRVLLSEIMTTKDLMGLNIQYLLCEFFHKHCNFLHNSTNNHILHINKSR